MENIRNIIESLLFVSDAPLTIDKLKTVLETVDAKEIRSNLNALADQYEARGGSFRLCEVAGGWQLRSRPEYHEYIKRLLQPPPQRLSRAALETLAIVAYNQPIIRADIEHIRGVDCGGMLRQLLERKLIRVLGRKEIPGRPLIYATSKLFLELFELKNLKDLPTPKEIEEMGSKEADAGGQPLHTMVSDQSMAPSDSDAVLQSAASSSPYQRQQTITSTQGEPKSQYRHSGHLISRSQTTGAPATATGGKDPIAADPHKIAMTPSAISPTMMKMPAKNDKQSSQSSPQARRAKAAKNKTGNTTTPNSTDPKKP